MAIKIFGYTVPPIVIVGIVLLVLTTPEQKSALWEAATQYCNAQDMMVVQLTDTFISTVEDKNTREQLEKLKSIGEVSLDIEEHAELLNDLHEKKKIKFNPGCIIVGSG